MGLLRDFGMLVGILPIEKPYFKRNQQKQKNYINKFEQLEKLSGQTVIIDDKHNGSIVGDLVYRPFLKHKYILNNCSRTGKPKILNVHDLININYGFD